MKIAVKRKSVNLTIVRVRFPLSPYLRNKRISRPDKIAIPTPTISLNTLLYYTGSVRVI